MFICDAAVQCVGVCRRKESEECSLFATYYKNVQLVNRERCGRVFFWVKRVLRHYLRDRTAGPGAHSTTRVRSKNTKVGWLRLPSPRCQRGAGAGPGPSGCHGALAGATRSDKEYDAVGAAFGAFVNSQLPQPGRCVYCIVRRRPYLPTRYLYRAALNF